jgi:two-component system response regulator PhoP
MRLLVVEDELALQQHLKQQLTQQGYSVDCAKDGEEGLYLATEYPYDVAIIDLGLPKIDGLSLIEKLRKQQINTPILILTARSQWQEKVKGLEMGADDYVTKPFEFEEVLARVKALLRRSAGVASSELTFGHITLNLNSKQVKHNKTQQLIDLTAYEYNLLEYLCLHPHQVVSKTELTEHLYEQDFERDSNVIEVFVGRLRRKLADEQYPTLIETLRGRGYRINPACIP